jgi:hypothetical protein
MNETQLPTRVQKLDEARRVFGSRADHYASFYSKGDPLADDVVLAFEALPRGEGQRMLERALAEGIEAVPNAPLALVRLFAQLDDVPPWVDWERIHRGARAYMRPGLFGGLSLSAVGLLTGYHSHAAVKPLAFTGRLDQMAQRRLAETSLFVLNAFQIDALRRGGKGFAMTVRVRMIHAQIRRHLSRSPAWRTEEWGVPINNADMAATNIAFSIGMLRTVRQLGFRFTTDEADDVMLLWRYVGYLSGVDIGLLATSDRDALELAHLIVMLQPGPDEHSRKLADALRSVYTYPSFGTGPWLRFFTPFVGALHDGIAHAAGEETGRDVRELGVPHYGWRHAVPIVRALVTPFEVARERLPFASRIASWNGNRAWRKGASDVRRKDPVTLVEAAQPAFEHRFRPRAA